MKDEHNGEASLWMAVGIFRNELWASEAVSAMEAEEEEEYVYVTDGDVGEDNGNGRVLRF